MNVFRTPDQEAKYNAYRAAGNLDKGCALCAREPVQEFELWRIIENRFPYDRVAKEHYMVIPKRHVTETGLSLSEKKELARIKKEYFHKNYDFVIEAMEKRKSIPGHFHLHLIVSKD